MACMKCGKETAPKEVFCEECLAAMHREPPVKPETRVSIPKRPKNETPHVQPKKRSPEEQLARLRRLVRVMAVMLVLLALSTAVSIGVIVHHLATAEHGGFGIGQNYSTEAPDNVDHGR